MNKLNRFRKVSGDVLSQIDSPVKRLGFLYGIMSHYALKLLGISYNYFPEMKMKKEGCVFSTRKDTIDFWMYWKNYEKDIFSQLEKEAKPGDTFVDVGANIGAYTVVMAKRGLNVYSFEPVKTNFETLEKNLDANRLKGKAEVFNLGLGSEKKKAEIVYNPHEHGESSLVLEIKEGIKEEVNLDRLDNLNLKIKGKCFMKIDVEGFEYEVLRGAEKFIRKNRPAIIIEIWSDKTTKYLKDLGYEKNGEIWHSKRN